MSLIKKCLCTGIILIFLASCNVLDKNPQLGISGDNAIHDAQSAQNALNGLYSLLKDGSYYGGIFPMMSDISSDISQSIGTYDIYRAMDTYNLEPTQFQGLGNFWTAAYSVINQANNIIASVSSLDNINKDIKNRILGETYFIRALAYFDLNRSFGGVKGVYGSMGVPIVLEPTRSIDDIKYPSRSSINETYKRVESDLKKALELLPTIKSPNPTRASEAAVKALLSRLYLYYKQDFSLVEKYATEVISDYNYKLTDNYAAIFKKEKTIGSIFELSSTVSDQSLFQFYYFPGSLGGRAEFALQKKFVRFAKSRSHDNRLDLIAFSDQDKVYYPIKYQKLSGGDNVQILRLAEMYLNRAEARVRKQNPNLQGALSDINTVRNRAGLPDTTGSGVDTPKEILHLIAKEREAEFFEEGHRWFNLLRTGRALNILQNLDRAMVLQFLWMQLI